MTFQIHLPLTGLRTAAFVLLALVAAACVPVETRPCPSELTCVLSRAIVDEYNRDAGRKVAPGLRFLSAHALGPTVLVDFGVPVTRAQLGAETIQRRNDEFTPGIVSAFCDADNAETFLDVGGAFRIRVLDANLSPLFDRTLRSCRG